MKFATKSKVFTHTISELWSAYKRWCIENYQKNIAKYIKNNTNMALRTSGKNSKNDDRDRKVNLWKNIMNLLIFLLNTNLLSCIYRYHMSCLKNITFLYDLINKKFPSPIKYIDTINGSWTQFGAIPKIIESIIKNFRDRMVF